MAANIYDWSLVAANNATADADLTWAEGMLPSAVNNSARVMMQRGRQILTDIGGSISAGGSANALTVAAASPFAAYADGQIVAFRATATNTTAATLNVNGIGTKSIRKMNGSGDLALEGGEITTAGLYVAQYSAALNGAAGGWLLINPTIAHRGTYTPTITASVGTFTTTSATGAWTKVDRLVTVKLSITITTVGSASGSVLASVPFTAAATPTGAWIIPGRETIVGSMLQGVLGQSAIQMAILKYDNTSVIAAGANLQLSGTYWV